MMQKQLRLMTYTTEGIGFKVDKNLTECQTLDSDFWLDLEWANGESMTDGLPIKITKAVALDLVAMFSEIAKEAN